MGQFLRSPPRTRRGGGNVRLHMSLQIEPPPSPPKKKRKTAANETRRGGSAGEERGGEGTFARLRLFGREVLPAHLSARPPAAPHTRRRRRINRPRRAQEGRCNTQQPLIAGWEVSVMSLIHNIRHAPRYRSFNANLKNIKFLFLCFLEMYFCGSRPVFLCSVSFSCRL